MEKQLYSRTNLLFIKSKIKQLMGKSNNKCESAFCLIFFKKKTLITINNLTKFVRLLEKSVPLLKISKKLNSTPIGLRATLSKF
ncbi:hypothetical protein BpHYR1_006633 [Brachionus plicatilis]|uniref:Uncharacterized protein n=1 Tax=Brachionus plicatilis TaxID=10195 RepID=A0A3M7SFJ3_BRAPC|nr:hypothetical protein BpHYR1_006633 [Brachionus plicatilis]